MTQTNNNYERLYDNMRSRFTVSSNNNEYTLGEYMLMKADSKNVKKPEPALPVALRSAATKSELAVVSLATFVNDKLTIKTVPEKDKTIRAFPLRASASAFLSASVACAFLLSFALIGVTAMGIGEGVDADIAVTEYEADATETASIN